MAGNQLLLILGAKRHGSLFVPINLFSQRHYLFFFDIVSYFCYMRGQSCLLGHSVMLYCNGRKAETQPAALRHVLLLLSPVIHAGPQYTEACSAL